MLESYEQDLAEHKAMYAEFEKYLDSLPKEDKAEILAAAKNLQNRVVENEVHYKKKLGGKYIKDANGNLVRDKSNPFTGNGTSAYGANREENLAGKAGKRTLSPELKTGFMPVDEGTVSTIDKTGELTPVLKAKKDDGAMHWFDQVTGERTDQRKGSSKKVS